MATRFFTPEDIRQEHELALLSPSNEGYKEARCRLKCAQNAARNFSVKKVTDVLQKLFENAADARNSSIGG